MVEKNGVLYAAKATKFLKENLKTDFRILFVGGGGPDERKVRDILKKDNTSSKIMMLPVIPHNEIKYLYNAVDIVIIPSIHVKGLEEATSIAAIEAMASGIPVIASNIGGLKEIIENGKNGFLIEQKNPEILAKKIIQIHNSNINQIIKNARDFVVNNCSHIERAKEYINSYNEIK
jgi:glycosyltransferase involved in cell wall biosynthesis